MKEGGVIVPFCKYCGSAHDADAIFCTECGKQISPKTAPPTKSVVEVPLSVETEDTIRVEDGERPYLPGDPITPEMKARVIAYNERVAQYTLSLTVFKQLFRENPDLFGEEEWKQAEAMLAEKYGLSDLSLYRQKELPDFEAERKAAPAPHRRNNSYTKRKTEYWSQFDKTEDDT